MTEYQIQQHKERYEHKVYNTKDGMDRFEIVCVNNPNDVDIRFIRTNTTAKIALADIRKGIVNPDAQSLPKPVPPLTFTDPYKRWVGSVKRNNQGDLFRIIDYQGYSSTTIQFLDEFGYTFTTTIQNVRKGEVHNPFHVNKFGGFIGDGPFTKTGGRERDLLYTRWHSMLIRANDAEYYKSHHGSITDAYDNTSIVPEWLCFNNFAIWFSSQISNLNPIFDYDIDKDLLYRYYKNETNGMKCYGPKYCIIIPHSLNASIRSMTSDDICSKDQLIHIKQELDKYYANNALSTETYNIVKNIVEEYLSSNYC